MIEIDVTGIYKWQDGEQTGRMDYRVIAILLPELGTLGHAEGDFLVVTRSKDGVESHWSRDTWLECFVKVDAE